MVHIKLERSGGQLGKSLQASKQVNIKEEDLIKKLKAIAPTDNPYARDDFHHTIVVGKKKFLIDMALLKGNLKKIVEELEENLKIEKDTSA
jgi:hypothetical protein